MPLAVHGVLTDGVVKLDAVVGTPDGKEVVKASGEAPASKSVALGEQIAADLLKNGAGEIIRAL